VWRELSYWAILIGLHLCGDPWGLLQEGLLAWLDVMADVDFCSSKASTPAVYNLM
jgi:hypothetical protein